LLTPVVTYDPDDIVVTLNQQSVSSVVPPAGPSSAGTPNQRAVAAGLDGAIAVNASGFAAALNGLDQLSAPGVRASLDRLSGEANADLPSLALMAGEQFTGQIRKQGQLARLGDSGTDAGQSAMAAGGRQQVASLGGGPSENALANIEHPWGVWTSGYGQTGQLDGDGNAHSLNETIAGGAFGADYRLYPALRIGAALGYGRTTYSLDNVGDHGFIDHTQVGLYADYSVGRAYIDGTIGIAFGDATTRRDVSLPGTRAEARGNSSSTEILGSFEGGYALALGTATLTPFVGLSFGSVDQNGFAEIGAGALDLATHKQTLSSVKTALGARLNNDLTLAGRVFTTDLSVGWSHEFAAIDRNVLTAFSGAPATGFLIDGARVARNSAIVGLGFATAVSTKGNVYLHYDGDLAGSATSHAISAGFHYSW
jgi:subtilase-type serine protease